MRTTNLPRLIGRSLALSVLTLAGCSTTSTPDDNRLQAIGQSLTEAGSRTAEISSQAWQRTVYLLGFSDVDPADNPPLASDGGFASNRPSDQMLDEVDLALLEEDAVLPPDFYGQSSDILVVPPDDSEAVVNAIDNEQARPVESLTVATIESTGAAQGTLDTEGARTDDRPMASAASRKPATSGPVTDLSTDAGSVLASTDYVHEVAENETLWDIAKAVTGDATQWHTIADVNDLLHNAPVHPGQKLAIPSELVKPALLAGGDDTATAKASGTGTETATGITSATTSPETERMTEAETATIADGDETLASESRSEHSDTSAVATQAFTLKQGESLWEFARRTTGDATNWAPIAAANGLDEKAARLVFPGQTIEVPEPLLRERSAADIERDETVAEVRSPDDETTSMVAAVDTDSDRAQGADGSAATATMQRAKAEVDGVIRNEAPDSKRPMQIVEAAFQGKRLRIPGNGAGANGDMPVTNNTLETPTHILVSGTYYPKAIYNEADFSSSLLMRVSPGTRLEVAGSDGPWLEVQTERGRGYMHERDIK